MLRVSPFSLTLYEVVSAAQDAREVLAELFT